MQGAIEMGAERDAVVVDGSMLGQRENLVAATVGEQRVRPLHEPDDPSMCRYGFRTWAKPQMVGVGQDDAGTRRLDVLWRERLDGRLGSDRHERRRLDRGARRGELTAPRVAIHRIDLKGKPSGREAHRGPLRISIASP